MPQSVLTRKRSTIARIAILAMVFSLMAVALPASAHSVALDSTGPCPAATPSAGFTDIGGLDATTQTAINCLFAFGITTGTSATTYSPNDVITRWQMALFLVRQAADHGLTIPAATGQGYTDIGGFDTATQNAINQITQMGISKGTSSTTFSPNDGVTRWQMALFIYRLGLAAGVTFNNSAAHNEFLDIADLSAEAMTAINALADTKADPEGHIALGTGLSLFSPNLVLVRWQMALFLTRLLAADGVAAPAGIRVTVTPTDAVTLAGGAGRAYTATFKNLDGTPYTGAVGITLKTVVSGVIQYDNDPVPTAAFESVSDGLVAPTVAPVTPTVQGFPGTNGIVTFVVRDTGGGTETVVPIAWEDLNNDDLPGGGITANTAPTEPFGVGGAVTFSAPAVEATSGGHIVNVISVTAASDAFVGNPTVAGVSCGNGADVDCTFNYDSGDLFLVDGVPVPDLATFEAALNAGDVVTMTYAAATADQSTFNISTDVDPPVTVTNPAAATSTTAATYTITGTGVAGYLVSLYTDIGNDGAIDGTDTKAAEVTVAADGTWSATVNLTTGTANDFTANQRAVSGDANGSPINVPTITQGAVAGVTLTSTVGNNAAPSSAGILSPADTITITFSGAVQNVSNGDTIGLLDADGTTATITLGPAGNASFTLAGNVLTLTLTGVLTTTGGGTAGINPVAQIQSITGFESATTGAAINVSGSGAGRTFAGF